MMKNSQESYQRLQDKSSKTCKILSKESALRLKKNKVLRDVVSSSRALESGSSVFFYGGRPIRAVPADIVRTISESSQDDSRSLLIRNIILNTVMSLETTSSYSGFAFLKCLRGEVPYSYKKRVTPEEAYFLISQHVGKGISYEIIRNITENRGISRKINFVPSETKKDFVVTKKSSWDLSGSLPSGFEGISDTGIRRINNTRVLFVDGVIESVSEIHRLLETSSKETESFVILASNFSPDVVSTLDKNYKDKKLKVIPYAYSHNPDLLEFFQRNNVTCISYDSGELLNSLSIEGVSSFRDIVFSRGKLSILGLGMSMGENHFTVEVPRHFHKSAGVIEDRVRSGVRYFYELSKHGIALNEKNVPLGGFKQYRTAKKHIPSFIEMIKTLGCLIVVE